MFISAKILENVSTYEVSQVRFFTELMIYKKRSDFEQFYCQQDDDFVTIHCVVVSAKGQIYVKFESL